MLLRSKKVSLIAVTVAACIGSNYALIGIPNLKVMDLLVFVSGFVFGPLVGASIGILVWVVYGVLNPYGFVLPIWIATMLSESLYGFMGGVIARRLSAIDVSNNRTGLGFLFGAIGFFITFLYDLITNVAFALTFGLPIYAAIIAGIPFAIIHELSNTAIFGICSIPLVSILEKNHGRLGSWRF